MSADPLSRLLLNTWGSAGLLWSTCERSLFSLTDRLSSLCLLLNTRGRAGSACEHLWKISLLTDRLSLFVCSKHEEEQDLLWAHVNWKISFLSDSLSLLFALKQRGVVVAQDRWRAPVKDLSLLLHRHRLTPLVSLLTTRRLRGRICMWSTCWRDLLLLIKEPSLSRLFALQHTR